MRPLMNSVVCTTRTGQGVAFTPAGLSFPVPMNTEQIWSELHGGITAFVRRRVRNPADVDDIVQRVFVSVHRGLDSLRDDERLHGWIYRTARNAIIDYYRVPRREVASGDASDMANISRDVEAPASLEEERSALTELAACVQPLLDQLSTQDAEALRLTDIQGVTQGEAARQLGLSVSGMKSRVQRARTRFKEVVQECCRVNLDSRGGIIGYQTLRANACDPYSDCGERPTTPRVKAR